MDFFLYTKQTKLKFVQTVLKIVQTIFQILQTIFFNVQTILYEFKKSYKRLYIFYANLK